MTKHWEYYIKLVAENDIKDHLRLAGNVGWEMIMLVIKPKPKSAVLAGQMPTMEIYYEVFMKREVSEENESDTENEAKASYNPVRLKDFKKG